MTSILGYGLENIHSGDTQVLGNLTVSGLVTDAGGADDDPNAWKITGNSQSENMILGTINTGDVDIITEDTERLVIEEEGDLVVSNNSVFHSRKIDMTKVERFTAKYTTNINFTNDRTSASITANNTAVYASAKINNNLVSTLSVEYKITDAIINTTTLTVGICSAYQVIYGIPLDNFETDTLTGLSQNDIIKITIDQSGAPKVWNVYVNDVLQNSNVTAITPGNLRTFIYSSASTSSFDLYRVTGGVEDSEQSFIKTTDNFKMVDIQDNKFLELISDEMKIGPYNNLDLGLYSNSEERIVIDKEGDVLMTSDNTLHSTDIDMRKTERFIGYNGITYTNLKTKATVPINTAVYSQRTFRLDNDNTFTTEVKLLSTSGGFNTTVYFGVCDSEEYTNELPTNTINKQFTGLQINDTFKIFLDNNNLAKVLYFESNGASFGQLNVTLTSTSVRFFIYSESGEEQFELLNSYVGDPSTSNLVVSDEFKIKDYEENEFFSHSKGEINIAQGSTTDVIRIYKPIEGSEGTEFEPYDVVINASSELSYTEDTSTDIQTLTVSSRLLDTTVPNLLPFGPPIAYTSEVQIEFTFNNTATTSQTVTNGLGIALYTIPPLNYTTTTGTPQTLYGNEYNVFDGFCRLTSAPSQATTLFETLYINPNRFNYQWYATGNYDVSISTSSQERNGNKGLLINFYRNKNILIYSTFAKVYDNNNPTNTIYEIFCHQLASGTVDFNTTKSAIGSNVIIQGYEVAEEFERLAPYDNTNFNISDYGTIGNITNVDYIVDFDGPNTSTDFNNTEDTTTKWNITKTSNNLISYTYAETPLDVSKYNYVIELITSGTNSGLNQRFSINSLVYQPTVDTPFTSGLFGDGYTTNVKGGSTNHSINRVLNGVGLTEVFYTTSSSLLSKVKYTIVDGVLTMEYDGGSGYVTAPTGSFDLLTSIYTEYYCLLLDSTTTTSSINCTIEIIQTDRDLETPSLNINGDENKPAVINFNGDLEIKSNLTPYMDMADSKVLLNQPLMLKSGNTDYMLITPNQPGLMFWNSEVSKMAVSTLNTWQVPGETIEVLISVAVQEGNVMIPSSTVDYEVILSNATSAVNVMGVIAWKDTTPSGQEYVTLAVGGYWNVKCEASTYTRDDYLASTNTGLAYEKTGTSNSFAISSASITLNSGDLLRAWVHCID